MDTGVNSSTAAAQRRNRGRADRARPERAVHRQVPGAVRGQAPQRPAGHPVRRVPGPRRRAPPRPGVRAVTDVADAATAECADGTSYQGAAVIAADGCTPASAGCSPTTSPSARASSPTAVTAGVTQVTARSRLDEVVAWIRACLHFVQYPLRAGELYNQVAVFRSPKTRPIRISRRPVGGPDQLDQAFAASARRSARRPGAAAGTGGSRCTTGSRFQLARGLIACSATAAHPRPQTGPWRSARRIEDAGALDRTLACCPPGPGCKALDQYEQSAPRTPPGCTRTAPHLGLTLARRWRRRAAAGRAVPAAAGR